MTAATFSPVAVGLRLPYRLYDSTEPTTREERAEKAVEVGVEAWVTYDEPFLLDIPRLLLRPDLTPEQYADLARELCERSIDVDDAVRSRVAIAYADDYARHLSKMATAPAAVSE